MLSYIFIPNELTFKVKNERKTAYTAIQPSSNSHQKFIFAKKKKKNPTQNIPLTTTAKLENMSSDTKYFLDTSNC